MKEKIIRLFKNKGFVIVFVGVLGLVLILISYIPAAETEKAEETDYVLKTEEKLRSVIESIDGAGKTKVMLTLSTDGEKVYKKTSKTDNGKSEESVVIVSGKDGNEALVEKTLSPEIMGVAVVCEGGDSSSVKAEIINVISALCGIEKNRICVCKLSE